MRFIEDIQESIYMQFEENHPKAHFLQSYSWGQFAIKGKHQIPHYVGLIDDNDNLLCAALLLEKKLPMGFSYMYSPRGFIIDYKNKDLVTTFTKELKNYMKRKKVIYIKMDPDIKYQTIDDSACPIDGENNYEIYNFFKSIGYVHKGFNKLYEGNQPRYTFRINLKKYSKEELDTVFNKAFMKSVKRSYNYEMVINNEIKVDEFYNLIQFNSSKDDFHSYSKSYYSEFTKEFTKYNNVKYYNALINTKKVLNKLDEELKKLQEELEKDKKHKVDIENKIERVKKDQSLFHDIKEENLLVCSLICVYTKNKAWSLYIGNNDLGNYTFAVSRCYYESIIDAKNDGYEFYDLFGTVGDPNTKYKNLAKLHDFKRKFGDEYIEFIGEFDLVNNRFIYKILPILLKIYRKVKK